MGGGCAISECDRTDNALMLDSGAAIRPRVDLSKLDGHWVNVGCETEGQGFKQATTGFS